MSNRRHPHRRRTSAPLVRPSRFSRKLLLEPLEDRRMLAVAAGFDFGDAPDPYPTTLADNGARHEAIGPTLGALRDDEADGQPSSDANGDGADEDGVTFGPIRVGQLDATLTVNIQNAPNGAKLDAWIDFNGDGNWGGPGEQIFDSVALNNGDNTLEFDVPSWAGDGDTYARFRLSSDGDLGIGGTALDGEVEDYQVTINPPAAAPRVFETRESLSFAAYRPRSVFVADVDGDGDMDVLSASSGDDKIAWYENDGSQSFTTHTISTAADSARSVFAADVDGDGDIDVLSASANDDKIAWYENDGGGAFTAHTISTAADGARSVFAVDVDGDGDIDVLSASLYDDKIAWYENDGDEAFTAHTISTSADGAISVFAADVDGDGDIDVLSASLGDDKIAWYENDGSQGFTSHTISTAADGARSVFATDVDGDGDIDVLSASFSDRKIAWYENDGDAGFTAHIITTAVAASSVFAVDVDGDGDIDVLSSSSRHDKTITWYENDGNQSFTAHVIGGSANGAYSVFAADLDSDGDIDVLSAFSFDDEIKWYENDGSEMFTAHTVSPVARGATSVIATDLDGDGDMDVLSASTRGRTIAWYENDGSAGFKAHTITTVAYGANSVFAADVDGDGDMDVLSASWYDDKIAWYENDGSENFTAHTISTAADFAGSVFAADVDGDGDIDVLSASYRDDKIAWYENDGSENFTAHTISTAADGAVSVFAADVDGDGDMDVLSASNADDKIAWYENNGSQSFVEHRIGLRMDGASSVFASDVDGDGDIDVLTASARDNRIAWYENDGTEGFTAHTISITALGAQSVFAADVDGDGDIDVLSASYHGENVNATYRGGKIAWYENDGSQAFTEHIITTDAEARWARSVFAADLDGDGDLDVLSAAKYAGAITWYESLDPGDFGDAPAPYPSRFSEGGAVHIARGPKLGVARDAEPDGQPTALADGDGDDEDGVTFASLRVGQVGASVNVNVQDAPAGAKLDAWIDFDGNGAWDGPLEQIADSLAVVSGVNVITFDVSLSASNGTTYARFRLSTAGNLAPQGAALDGEVEDYQVTILPFETGDFGDAPVPYPSRLSDRGAAHHPGGPTLGADRDLEEDGQPSANADGEGVDEDGISFAPIRVGQLDAEVTINVQSAPVGAKVDAWIDFNRDGNWGGPGERIAASVSVVNGDNRVLFDVPSNAASGETFARFRLSTAGGLGFVGAAADGEVEDYRITIDPPAEALGVFGSAHIVADGGFVAAADVDGDGDMDLLSVDVRSGLAWHENDGQQNFMEHVIIASGASSVSTADVDGDGDVDVIGLSGSTLSWFENDGGGNFVERQIAKSVSSAPAPITVDMDGDGDIDILAGGENRTGLTWYENDGQQSFTSHAIVVDRGGSTIFTVDLDRDGDMDVLVAGNSITWYENDGQQNFSRRTVNPQGFGGPFWSLAAADVDGDGDIDVLAGVQILCIGGGCDFDHLIWLENDGNQRFTEHVIERRPRGPLSIFVADVDGDGDPDLLSASAYGAELSWYENSGHGEFTKHTVSDSAERTSSVFAADIDGDGDLDILSASRRIVWHENLVRGERADLTGDGFVDFEDLTSLLSNWNQNVSAEEGNLVDPGSTPVNFEDLTVLLAAWTGPGAAAAAGAAAVRSDRLQPVEGDRINPVTTSARRAAAYAFRAARRAEAGLRPAGGTYGGRLQAAAVDRALGEELELRLLRRRPAFARRGSI